jgi:threonine dehydrogenase-like Zn-dependent dehydrogenase
MTTSGAAAVPTNQTTGRRPKVVIIGSGFGGLFAAQRLRKADVDVTLVAKTGHHLFQPLLYQVATGIISEGEIAPPTRDILKKQDNATVILGEVVDIDLAEKTVTSWLLGRETSHSYDHLIVAAGAGQSYFGNSQFSQYAPGMKSVDDALELRGRILGAFEMAEVATDPAERFTHAHMAALRVSGAVLAVLGTRPPRGRTRSAWERLSVASDDFIPWASFFASGAHLRSSIAAGRFDAVDEEGAARWVAAAEDFRDEVGAWVDDAEVPVARSGMLVDGPVSA